VAVVALLTDFGTRDHYVGAMKAVVLSVCPDATLVDITHEIPPQDVLSAALELAAAYRYFPPATVFLTVVDPGVGSERRGIAAAAAGYYFVGPDNGVFAEVFREAAPTVVELRERKYARPAISRTFEGRDRFAPAAGWLARGVELRQLGPAVSDLHDLAVPAAVVDGDQVRGEILRIDRFGNLITNIARSAVATDPRRAEVRIGSHRVAGIVSTYAEAAPGALCALIGSSERLEIAVNGGSAAEAVGAVRGTEVQVTLWYHRRLP
jgi:S-adenosylmethionine hydrolase